MTKVDAPLSESSVKIKDASAEDCIKYLREMAEADPDKIITRNWFRVNGPLAESAWNRHFGTFEEFKRQAGVTLTRHQRRMELHVAKHASADNYRLMNVDRQGWEDKYLKPTGRRFQTIMVASDIHDTHCDPFWLRVFFDTLQRVQPDVLVLGGDVWDACEFGKYTVDPRNWDVVGRIKWVHTFLKQIRERCPDLEIHALEGNHEARLLKHLAEASPAMRAVLSDLHGFTVSKLLGLDDYEVNYIARCDLAAFNVSDMNKELKKNYWVGFDTFLVHHFPDGKAMGLPGCNGHHHKHVVDSFYSPIFSSYEWHQLGSGHIRAAEYCAGEKWNNGFLLAHVDTERKRVQQEYFHVLDHVVVGGKWYERSDLEVIHAN